MNSENFRAYAEMQEVCLPGNLYHS